MIPNQGVHDDPRICPGYIGRFPQLGVNVPADVHAHLDTLNEILGIGHGHPLGFVERLNR